MSAATQGQLSEQVFAYVETMRGLVPSVTGPADWAPLAEFVAVDEFGRVGTFLEVQNWEQYTEMLTQWASATDSFETPVRAHLRARRPRLLRGRGAAPPAATTSTWSTP